MKELWLCNKCILREIARFSRIRQVRALTIHEFDVCRCGEPANFVIID